MQKKINIIYIISDRRSGSTLLENILSKSGETVSVGELAMLKGHIEKDGQGELWNWNCSCRQPIMQCTFWSKVLAGIYDDSFETKIKWFYKSLNALYTAVLPGNAKKNLLRFIHTPESIDTTKRLNTIYKALANVSTKNFIVDSSKDPIQALAVNECEDVDAKFIWLSRDLRAITVSKLRRWYINKRSDKKALETLTDSLFYKKICGAAFKTLDKNNIIKIAYEMLASNPQEALDAICTKFSLQKYKVPAYMELVNDHTIAGTPGRFERKLITADNSWKAFYEKRFALNALGKFFNSL